MHTTKLKALALAVSAAGMLVACGEAVPPENVLPTPGPTDSVVITPTVTTTATPTVTTTATPTVTTTATPTVTTPPTATPIIIPSNPAIWCPTADNFDPSKAYQGGDRVIMGGNVYEATGWTQSPPKPGAPTDWENPWRLVGSVSANWCEGKAIDAKGNDLPMGSWGNFPMVRRFQPYDVMANNLMVGTYYPEWGIYGRGFETHHIPFQGLTHIYYAFAPVCGDNSTSFNEGAANGNFGATNRGAFCQQTNEINIYDDWAATEKSFEGDSYATPLKGLFGQFTRAKVAHPHIRVQMSVGGWTLSRPFFEMADDPAKRAVFVKSVGRFLSDYATTFDGIDIDWEFPGAGGNDPDMGCATVDAWCYDPNTYDARVRDADNFADLMVELRAELDRLGVIYGKHFELGAAVSPDPVRAADYINWDRAAPAMDFINVMTYDYAGGWNKDSLGYNTSMRYPSSGNPEWNTEGTIRRMLDVGVPAHKLVVGVAKYGRGWEGVTGWEGDDYFTGQASRNFPEDLQECQDTGCRTANYSGPNPVGKVGAWELGIADYAYIEQEFMGGPDGQGINGWTFRYDPVYGGAYVWHEGRGALLGFDSKETVMDKGRFVKELGLGGLFSWEITGDSGTINNAMNEALGKPRR